jgi:hypothetical protein
MKTLTIKQPWVDRLVNGSKRYEYRSWRTNYRGVLLIHAGKSLDPSGLATPEELAAPRGAIVAVGRIIDCLREDAYQTNWSWDIRGIVRFEIPVACQGKLGLWECTAPDVIAMAESYLPR